MISPLFALDRVRQEIGVDRARQQLGADGTGVMDAIITQVRQSYAQVNSRQKQFAIAEQAVQSARESFELNRNRIFEKQGLSIEVLPAIESLANARQLYVDTVTDYNNQAQFRLLTAVGQSQ